MNDSKATTVFDFSNPDHQQPWESIDDRIMGGFSQSQAEIADATMLRFSGRVSLQNHGGFASVRSPGGCHDLSGCSQIMLRVKGDGQRYKLGLRIDLFFDGVTYLTGFETKKEEWQEISLPLEAFQPTHHGQRLANAAQLDPSRIMSFGLLISDQQEGPFRLDLAWIKAV